MLTWLLCQLERIERIHAAADMLVNEFGVEASGEARRREREANSAGTARDWRRVASVIARRVPMRDSVDSAGPTPPECRPVAESTQMASEPPQAFRIQFVCGMGEHGPTSLTEKHIHAPDASAAIVAAANAKWPPRTIGLRILDREGREVFAREKASRR